MKKLNIIQFMPYFPPHKWWLETVWQEIWTNWSKHDLGVFINVVTSFNQEWEIDNLVIFEWENIWYKKNNITHLVIPSFEIINNFPMYKIWDKKTKLVFEYLKEQINVSSEQQEWLVITHTRFFLTSLFGWIFARKNKLKWIHIEHWSDYVKLWSKFKSKISYIYDRIFWKWIFKKADIVLAISEACKNFIQNKFINREVRVFYRGVDLWKININKSWDIKIVFVWRLVKLKWVDYLINAYKNTLIKNELIIIWDWDEMQNLKNISKELNISFLWFKNRDFIIDYLSKNNFILVNPSFQEWLPTTVIEWLMFWCPVLASDVWWTKEISNKNDLILFEVWDMKSLEEKIIDTLNNYDNLKWLSFEEVNKKFSRESNIFNLYNLIK
jgi:hypothetical protein